MLLWSSCSPSRYCAKRFPPQVDTILQVDTVWTERILRIEYPADTVMLFIPRIEIDRSGGSNKPVVKFTKSKQASVKVTIDSTGLQAEAICSEKDSIIKILQSQINRKEKISSVQTIPVKRVPWYLKWAGYWALGSIPVFLFMVFNKIRKLFTII